MTTLTETAYFTRRTINWLILMVILYFIGQLLFSGLVALWLFLFPPKPPPPNHRFGKLPVLVFPKQASSSGQLTFRLETIEGTVPRASDSGVIYFMPKTPANLLAMPNTQEFAQKLEFDPTPIQETKNIYRFDDPDYTLRKLKYDIVSNHFLLRYGFEEDTGIFDDHVLPDSEAAKEEVKTLLKSFTRWDNDLVGGTQTATYLKVVSGALVTTTSLSVSDALEIDFFRKDIGDMHVFTPNPDIGPVSVIFSGSKINKKRIIQFAYDLWPIEYTTTGTYPLKSSSQAWQELQSGAGVIARYPRSGNTATVRNIYLAYYDTIDPQIYMQPIFIFEGDYGFLGYVPAVVQEWTE